MRIALITLVVAFTIRTDAAEPKPVPKQHVIEAAREFRKAVKIIADVQSAITVSNPSVEIAIPKSRRTDYLRARKHLRRSIDLNSYYPETYVFLANSYWELEDDLVMTIKYYSKAIDLDPTFDSVISARAAAFIQIKRIKDAEADLARLDELKSEFASQIRREIEELKASEAK